MATLSVAILGLGRVGTSVGLALRRYMKNKGKYEFQITGYDPVADTAKAAQKAAAVDRTERHPEDAAAQKDIVLIVQSYELVEATYRRIAPSLREGAVILDASPLKRPSLGWAKTYLGEAQHLVGITPIVNPKYLFNPIDDESAAAEDLFDDSTLLITPAPSCAKAAVDLAFNFGVILGSKPRFLDPLEHDTLLAQTETLPSLLGAALFAYLQQHPTWGDMKWFTNPAFGVMVRVLHDKHPDALRDEWMLSRDVLVRTLDEMINVLADVRGRLQEGDQAALEAFSVTGAEQYERWVNQRLHPDWDQVEKTKVDASQTMLGSLLGEKFARRLTGKKDSDT